MNRVSRLYVFNFMAFGLEVLVLIGNKIYGLSRLGWCIPLNITSLV